MIVDFKKKLFMKTSYTLSLFFGILMSYAISAQDFYSIGFEKDTISISRTNQNDVLTPINIESIFPDSDKYKNYSYVVNIIRDESTLSNNSYELIDFSKKISLKSNKEKIYFLLEKDSVYDRERKVFLEIKIFDSEKDVSVNNIAKHKKLTLIIKEHKSDINHVSEYTYLSYVGTNFDLVDGIKAQNLFFATNIYLPNRHNKNKTGFYLSLYGNRAMSEIDSTGNVRRTYKIEKLTDTTYVTYTEQSKMIKSRVSDNIGAHFSILFPIFKKNVSTDLSLFYSPSLEFIWRRTSIIREFSNPKNLESNNMVGFIPGTIEIGTTSRSQFNEYSFNAGFLGLFLTLENSDVSVRIHGSVGYSSNFYPKSSLNSTLIIVDRSYDIFFAGRAWITEPQTGLTLQAEITNTNNNPRPFFGVTLSKAFDLKDLSGVFSPLASRANK